MKKRIIFLLCVSFIFCFLFFGCRDIPEVISDNDPILEIASDFFYLASEQVFYECDYGGYGLFYVPLISGFPLTQSELEVELAGTLLTKEQCILGGIPGREERVELPFYASCRTGNGSKPLKSPNFSKKLQIKSCYKSFSAIIQVKSRPSPVFHFVL